MSKALLISEIIENFFIEAYPDVITQRSMVLVNRSWCSIGLKHLWKAPFASFLYEMKKPPKHMMIISVYVSLFDAESISVFAKSLSTAIAACQKSTYNYATFLEHLDVDNLRELVERWLLNFAGEWLPSFFPYEEFEDLFDELTMTLLTHICKLFLNNSKKITHLCIKRPEFLIDIYTFWKYVFNTCSNISTLDLDLRNIKQPELMKTLLPEIIKKQKNLKNFALASNEQDISSVVLALKEQANSLNELCLLASIGDLEAVESLELFTNLKTLDVFIDLENSTKSYNQLILSTLSKTRFSKLENMRITVLGSDTARSDLKQIVKNYGETLKELSFCDSKPLQGDLTILDIYN
ncbi:hypothetical protein C2G38_2206379 [Gigaspora rosea]|uniref:F-box domain-containing protein n=1 Tax=Gigaspora rosea TaxID=44941 RepID=A0A397UJE1_9GLOM|nr:hypothetical protein C2G38_2206379 [Gigaspora rosea]